MPQLLFRGKRSSKQRSPPKANDHSLRSSPLSPAYKRSKANRMSNSDGDAIPFIMPPHAANAIPTTLQDLLKGQQRHSSHHRHGLSSGSESDIDGLGPLVEEEETDDENGEGARSPATARGTSPGPSPGTVPDMNSGSGTGFPTFSPFNYLKSGGSSATNDLSTSSTNTTGTSSESRTYNPSASRETIPSSETGTETDDSGVSHSLAALSEHAVIYEQGLMMRNHVLGEDFVQEKNRREGGQFSLPMQTFATETAWGTIWTRPGLELKTRSLLCLAMLTALGRWTELATHVRGAIRNGCSEVEIQEALLQASAYCGLPSGFEAFRTAEKVLNEMRVESKETF